MQFKAQHDVPIYTNPEDQIPVGGTAPDTSRYENPGFDEDATSIFHTRSEYAANSTVPPVSAPIAPDSSAAYHGSHEASSPEEARNLGETRPLYGAPASAAYTRSTLLRHSRPHRLLHRLPLRHRSRQHRSVRQTSMTLLPSTSCSQ